VKLLLLVDARGGNMHTQQWVDERRYDVTAIYTEFFPAEAPLPPHDVVVNAIGDAERAAAALDGAEAVVAQSLAPVINPPERVRVTGRMENARRMAGLAGVIAPQTRLCARAELLADGDLHFPLLLRAPGFHTGQHFELVADRAALPAALAAMPGEAVLAIEYLDARGPDGMARKYRVLFIDGQAYPLHLAVSADWKVHYFTAAMAENAAYRAEERRFLEDMPGVLGARAMQALAGINATLGLDYAGVDFALAPDGSLLLFEANATMVILPPGPDPRWDYRRGPIGTAQKAAQTMLARRAARGTTPKK
jgi:glutathione synthase/RimK-type ligase-like ATP-grasp enzyme